MTILFSTPLIEFGRLNLPTEDKFTKDPTPEFHVAVATLKPNDHSYRIIDAALLIVKIVISQFAEIELPK